MEGCELDGAQLARPSLRDVELERCSLAAALARDATISRTRFEGCRLSGLTWAEGALEDVTFRDCRLDLAGFRFTRLQRVAFEECVLRDADFAEARCRWVRFERCDLTGAGSPARASTPPSCAGARSTASPASKGSAARRWSGRRSSGSRGRSPPRSACGCSTTASNGHNRPMADYTKLNLKQDVEDMAPKFDLSPGLESRFARKPLELEQSGVCYYKIAPGFRMPFGHRHGEQEEVYVIVSGSARLKLDDEMQELAEWDAVRIPATTMRASRAARTAPRCSRSARPTREQGRRDGARLVERLTPLRRRRRAADRAGVVDAARSRRPG